MATKPGYIQYSKRITTAVTVAWIIFRILTLALMTLRPDVAEPFIHQQQGADDVMMVAVGFYCGNSVAEKGIVGYFTSRGKDAKNPTESQINGNA